jgi:hypothetical protein
MEKIYNIFRVRGGIGDALLACCKIKTIALENQNIQNILIISGPKTVVSTILAIYKKFIYIDRIIFDPFMDYEKNVWDEFHCDIFNNSFKKICKQFNLKSNIYNLDHASKEISIIKSTKINLNDFLINNKFKYKYDYICLQPRSRDNFDKKKDWDSFIYLAEDIYKKTGYKSILIGGKKDSLNIKEKYIINLINKTSIYKSMQIVANAKAVVATSSWSPLLAAILHIPAIHLDFSEQSQIFINFFKEMGGNFNFNLDIINKDPLYLSEKLYMLLNGEDYGN